MNYNDITWMNVDKNIILKKDILTGYYCIKYRAPRTLRLKQNEICSQSFSIGLVKKIIIDQNSGDK